MKKTNLLTAIAIASLFTINAQSPIYNGPETLLQNSSGMYSSVKLPLGVSVTWSINTIGSVTANMSTLTAGFLGFYNIGLATGAASVVLTASLSNGTIINNTIPVIPQGPTLVQAATAPGTITMAAGVRQYPIYQLLRGERFKVKPYGYSGATPNLKLLDFQGRLIAQGDSIDFRAPVRGSYYVVVSSATPGQLKVEGIRPYLPSSGTSLTSTLTQPPCSVGTLAYKIDSTTIHTGGESMVTLGNKVVTCVYDFVLNKTILKAYQNDVLVWTWMSNPNEYIRTITADPTYGIAGIGSCGGALKSEDSVYVVKLNSNGVTQTRTAFGTSNGIDYGYGISFLNDGSLMATGFTEGNFPPFSNTGDLDAFAAHVSASGSILQTLQFGTNGMDRVFASRTLSNGNIALFGDTEGTIGSSSFGSGDIFLTEITPTCSVVTNKQYGSAENDLAFDLVIDPNSGDIIINGMTTGEMVTGFGNPSKPQVYTARINKSTYAVTWLKQLGPTEGQSGESIALSPTGVGVIFYTNGSFSGAVNNSNGSQASDDMVVALFDFNGNLDALYQFDQTTERIFARAITFEGNNIFVLRDHAYEPNNPFVTTSLDRFSNPLTMGINENSKLFSNYTTYPNPFTNRINIKNLDGKESFVVINTVGEIIFSGKNISEQDFSNLNGGIYFLSIKNEKTNATQVVKLLKQ